MDKADRKIRKLRDKAEKLRQAGNLKKALDIYHELEKRDPQEPRWPHLAGEAHKRFGQITEAVEHFTKAAKLYHKKGFDVKCVAMCKVLLVMDPLNATGNRLLEAVSGSSRSPLSAARPTPQPTGHAALAATGGKEISPPPPLPHTPTAEPSALPGGSAQAAHRSQSASPPQGSARSRGAKDTSPKELQALDLSELEDLLDGEARPTSVPTPPVPSSLPKIPAPLRPPGNTQEAANAPPLVDTPPRREHSPGPTMGKLTESLDIAIVVEEVEKQQHQGASAEGVGMEVTDNTFMESLPRSEAKEVSVPRRRPTLEPDAPLETLELEDIMPGTHRKPSGPVGRKPTEELFEVDIEDIEVIEDLPPAEPGRAVGGGPPPIPEKRPTTTPPDLFKKLGVDAMKSLVAQMSYLEKQPGEIIVRQGEKGGSLYVIIRGKVAITRETNGNTVQVSTLSDGEFFGEMALLTDTPRVASVKAITRVEMFELSRDTLRRLIQQFPKVVPVLIGFLKDRLLEIFVKTSDLLRPVPESKRWLLARKFKLYEIKEGKVVIKEGKPSGGLMIFLAGSAVATRNRQGNTVVLGELQPGSLVGEISMLTGGPAVATVTAKSKVWLLAISQRQFKTLTSAFPQMRRYVEQLADKRRKENAAIVSGGATYTSQTLRLV